MLSDESELCDGPYWISDIQYYIEYVLKKTWNITH